MGGKVRIERDGELIWLGAYAHSKHLQRIIKEETFPPGHYTITLSPDLEDVRR